MQVIYKVVVLILLLSFATASYSKQVSSKGMATINLKKSKPSKDELSKAMSLAKINAIERYVASGNNSNQKNYDLLREYIAQDIDSYVLGTVTVSEDIDSDLNRYTLVVRADINAVRLENKLQANSAVANASDAEKSYLTFVFVAREQASIKSYDDRVVKRKDASASEVGSDNESLSGRSAEYASENHTSDKVTTGGSSTKKSAVIEYTVSSASEINNVMTRVFSENNFEVVEAEYLEEETGGLLNPEQFKEDFSKGDDISGTTRRNAAKGVKMVEVPYLALGTLDIGLEDIDPASGLTRVYVSVSGKVVYVNGRFPKTVASVGPIQVAGIGPNKTVARTNALKSAAEKAAKDLADQLNAKGIK